MKDYVTVSLMIEKDAAEEVIEALQMACVKLTERARKATDRLHYDYSRIPDRAVFTEMVMVGQQIGHLQDTIEAIKGTIAEEIPEEEIPFG